MTHTRTSRGTRPCALPRRCDACGFRHSRDTHTLLVLGFKHLLHSPHRGAKQPWHVPHLTFLPADAAPALARDAAVGRQSARLQWKVISLAVFSSSRAHLEFGGVGQSEG